MKIPLNWLKEYIDLDVSVEDLCETMPRLGPEIESVQRPVEDLQQDVVRETVAIEPHPDPATPAETARNMTAPDSPSVLTRTVRSSRWSEEWQVEWVL